MPISKIYVVGDIHGDIDIQKLSSKNFPEGKDLTKNDYVIICGDFGLVWSDPATNEEKFWLKWLDEKPWTTLFVDGNHENFDKLNNCYEIVSFKGGKAHKIGKSIYHLMRGYIFTIADKKLFCFGGASSHDIQDGILNIEDYDNDLDMLMDYRLRTHMGQMLRINHLSWWEDELPSKFEMQRGRLELEKVNYEVDYVITHCLPQSIISSIYPEKGDTITTYFDELLDKGLRFKKWHCGHYHTDQQIIGDFVIHYDTIERIV